MIYNANKWLNAVDTMAEAWAKLQIGIPSIHGGSMGPRDRGCACQARGELLAKVGNRS